MKKQALFGKKLLVVAAITAIASAALPVSAQTFVGAFDVGPAGNAQKFNPLTSSAGFSFFNKYFGTLTLYDVSLQKISGDLAESWSYAKDSKSLTIKLRKGVKWHDGKPFSARDVKFTLDLIMNPELATVFAPRLAEVAEIKATDDLTVVLVLKSADVTLPDAFTNIMILPEHLLAKIPAKDLRNSDWWKTPVGTGPFKWTKYLPDQYVELEANKDFYRGAPKLAKMINRYFKDGSSAAIALQAGEIHHTYLTLDQLKDNQSNKNVDVVSGPSHVLNYIGFNNSDPRFKDLRVRQAILLALDRQSIVKNIFAGTAELANCVLTLPKFVPADLNKYETNAAKAKSLLAEAGWEKLSGGDPVELLTYYSDQGSKDVMATIQSMLAAVGVKVNPRFVDPPTYAQIAESGKFSMVFAGQANGPDPSVLNSVLDSNYAPPRGLNRMRVSIPEVDKLIEAGKGESDDGKRSAIYQQLCRVTNAQLPWVPLWVANRFGGNSKNAVGVIWTPAPGGGRYQDFPETWSLR